MMICALFSKKRCCVRGVGWGSMVGEARGCGGWGETTQRGKHGPMRCTRNCCDLYLGRQTSVFSPWIGYQQQTKEIPPSLAWWIKAFGWGYLQEQSEGYLEHYIQITRGYKTEANVSVPPSNFSLPIHSQEGKWPCEPLPHNKSLLSTNCN